MTIVFTYYETLAIFPK